MNGLANHGSIVAAGPLAGPKAAAFASCSIADADQEAEIVQRLADDPWERAGRIATTSIEP